MNRQVGRMTHKIQMPQSLLQTGLLHGQRWQLALVVALLLCATGWLATSTTVLAQSTYDYTVQDGESWETVAASTGISVESLKAANPEAAERESGWLLVGETLAIPVAAAVPQRIHKVQAGESWNSIAAEYNVPVALLRAANPNAVRAGNVLFRGDELIIPTPGAPAQPAAPTATATPTVAASATVTSTADEVAEDASEVETATSEVEDAEAEMTATVEAVATATVSVTATPTAAASDEVTTTETMIDTMTDDVAVGETEAMTTTAEVDGSESVTTTDEADASGEADSSGEAASTEPAFALPECPERFADYPLLMTELINSAEPDGLDAVLTLLDSCEASVDDGMEMADLNGDGSDELVVVYQNPSEDQIFVEGDLVIFNSTAAGYVLGYRARAAGEVRLLTVADVNLDELPDVVWVDTTCGASTCFDTVNVRSWDGSTWADWTDGTITMAYAEINLSDSSEAGLGEEIALEGGIYGSVGAGPQRSRSEVWASVEGAPYALVEKSYTQTECLYHTVLDANRALLDGPVNGFEAAITLYTQAVEDEGLIKCWVRNDEMAELRSFSLFRLALIAGYADDAESATALIGELNTEYAGSIYDEVGQLWLASYESSEDAAVACADVLAYAEEDSAAWEMLADYGYTNPSFEAIDVCPILNLSVVDDEAVEEEETE